MSGFGDDMFGTESGVRGGYDAPIPRGGGMGAGGSLGEATCMRGAPIRTVRIAPPIISELRGTRMRRHDDDPKTENENKYAITTH